MTFEAIDWDAWQPRERATLLFVVRGSQILLIHKKRGLGAGKINGPGGRLDPGETPEQCAIREVEEELTVTPLGVRAAGELRFQFVDGLSIHGYVFRADDCAGEPHETDEAIPLWTPLDAIPYPRMWADDPLWLPALLEGTWFDGRFLFDEDTLVGHDVRLGGPAGFSDGGFPEPDAGTVVVRLINRLGLHARAATMFVQLSQAFEAEVRVRRCDSDHSVDGRSVIQLITLAATQGTDLEITATGPGAGEILQTLRTLVADRFDEPE